MPIWVIVVLVIVGLFLIKDSLMKSDWLGDFLSVVLWFMRVGWKIFVAVGSVMILLSVFN